MTLNKTDRIVITLGTQIVGGKYVPGSPLPAEAELCEEFETSRNIIREVFRSLMAKRLIEMKRYRGAAPRVVRGFHAPDGGVEPWRAVAAVDADGVAEMRPQRLQDVEAELLEVADRRERRRVVYAPRGGDEGGGKLREAEVF